MSKIRFTGGEPLLHKEIIDMINYSSQIKGIDSIHLTTNGLLLDELALPLFEAGLKGINISLDTPELSAILSILPSLTKSFLFSS